MKIFILVLLVSQISQAQVVSGTSHKTDSGIYPYFFDDQGHPEVWDDAHQKQYDQKMGDTLKNLCNDNVKLGELEKEYIRLDHADGDNLNAHVEVGQKMDRLKDEIFKLSNIVVQGTGQSARTWGCK